MLTFAHYRFQQFLLWKAWEAGKQVLLVNEAFTSKTCSWSGEIVAKLGGRRWIQGLGRRPSRARHQRRPRDIPAGFGRYTLADAISVHRNRRC